MTGPRLHWPAGSLAEGRAAVALVPEDAGWARAGLRVLTLEPGAAVDLATADEETAVLPLAGALDVALDGRTLRLEGRTSVFTRVSDWAYLPIDTEWRLSSAGGCEVALPFARARRRHEPALVRAREVPVEVRGAGPATRQVTNFMAPEVFGGADRLMCVEVLTPDGNWSSYPPHRHDDAPECPVHNEEIYYFRLGRAGSERTAADGFAIHRTYTPDRSIDQTVVVCDGDVFCVPRGFHGPSIAAPGYPLYYLNVLASDRGPRSMAFCDDPACAWVRDSWRAMAPDPRCPMTGPAERGSR